jgi:UDP-N-acetylglucosamine 2-epimerase (non-hydrolysing)
MKLTLVAGARPNFMKIAPIVDAIKKAQIEGKNFSYRIVHTGQHFDANMSAEFFEQLGIPEPDINLECKGKNQSELTGAIMASFEEELKKNPSDLVVVVGDVTSTMACTIVAKKLCVDVAHVEGGIRSGDMSMPEEINRIVTDSISDYFFTTSRLASQNLIEKGVLEKKIFFVGNTMIDSVLKHRHRFQEPAFYNKFHLEKGKYFVLTLHRPNNVDDEQKLSDIIHGIEDNAHGLPVIFSVHPRTAKVLKRIPLKTSVFHFVPPMSYLEFNFLVANSKAVITDSGGVTEETTVLGIPCMTLRAYTERPETVNLGTNELIGANPEKLKPALKKLFQGNWKKGTIPELWDGKSAERIVAIFDQLYN